MSWTLVGHTPTSFADGGSGHTFNSGLGTATAGDWDILTANSDTTIPTPPSGWTVATSFVGNQGAYIYARKATGGESGSVTVTTNGNFNTDLTWSRWRGGNALDVAVNAHADNSSGTSTPAVSTGVLAASGELVLVLAAIHGASAVPTSPVWSAGYTALDSVNIDPPPGERVTAFTGYRTDAGTASESPSVSWTNAAPDRYILVVTFTPTTTYAVSESITLADAVSRTVVRSRAVSEPVTVSDAVTRSVAQPRAVSESLTLADSVVASQLRDLIVSVDPVVLKWTIGGAVPSSFPAISQEYVRIPVSATVGGQPVNPTPDPVAMAFLSSPVAKPGTGDWKTASWDTAPVGPPTFGVRYLAECLVGSPGGVITLTPGTWYVWLRITDSPEVVVRGPTEIQLT